MVCLLRRCIGPFSVIMRFDRCRACSTRRCLVFVPFTSRARAPGRVTQPGCLRLGVPARGLGFVTLLATHNTCRVRSCRAFLQQVGEDTADALSRCLATCPTLAVLNARGCSIGPAQARALAAGLSGRPSHPLAAPDRSTSTRAARVPTALRWIRLAANPLGGRGLAAVLEAVGQWGVVVQQLGLEAGEVEQAKDSDHVPFARSLLSLDLRSVGMEDPLMWMEHDGSVVEASRLHVRRSVDVVSFAFGSRLHYPVLNCSACEPNSVMLFRKRFATACACLYPVYRLERWVGGRFLCGNVRLFMCLCFLPACA